MLSTITSYNACGLQGAGGVYWFHAGRVLYDDICILKQVLTT